MNQQLTRLAQRYLTALTKHLRPGGDAKLRPALRLGRQAVALKMETLDLARIHEQSLATLMVAGHSSRANGAKTRQAAVFFTEANLPIEETHRAGRQARDHLGRLRTALGRRTQELAASNRQLAQDVARRKDMEVAAVKSGRDHSKSLEESLKLQTRLRQLTHRVMAAQEDERAKISHELQDEIAQTLLGINVRLLSLKLKSRADTRGFRAEIARTQQLVLKSAQFVRQFARELKTHQPA